MDVEMQPLSESLNRTWANAYTRIENSDFDQILRKVGTSYSHIYTKLIRSSKLVFAPHCCSD